LDEDDSYGLNAGDDFPKEEDSVDNEDELDVDGVVDLVLFELVFEELPLLRGLEFVSLSRVPHLIELLLFAVSEQLSELVSLLVEDFLLLESIDEELLLLLLLLLDGNNDLVLGVSAPI